jgi:hypothetical protein
MITNLRQQRSVRTSPMQASIRSGPDGVPGIREVAFEATRDGRDDHVLKLAMLEAEVLGLRQNLAEVEANRDALRKEMDDLRRDRDHWRKLASQSWKGRDRKPRFAAGLRQAHESDRDDPLGSALNIRRRSVWAEESSRRRSSAAPTANPTRVA